MVAYFIRIEVGVEMRILFSLLLTILFASVAQANCLAGEEAYLSCKANNGKNYIDVCLSDQQIVYRYGMITGDVELELARSVTDAKYTPWPGIGRTIWESVEFENNGTRYEVYGAIDKQMSLEDEENATRGGVTVYENDAQLAQTMCDEGTVEFTYGEILFEAKKAAGQCFEHGSVGWHACN